LNSWDFVTECPEHISILTNEENEFKSVQNRINNLLLNRLASKTENVTAVQTLKFQFSLPSNIDVRILKLKKSMMQMKYLTHLGEVLLVQLRQTSQESDMIIYEVTIHGKQQSTLIFIKHSIIHHVQQLKSNQSIPSIIQSDQTMNQVKQLQEPILELQDFLGRELREFNQGNIITPLKNMDQLFEQLIDVYTRMRKISTFF
jgi:flagellin-specific chaperone FliS